MGNIRFYLVLFILLGFASVAFAQSSPTATADASLNIIIPISIENNTDLNFGNIMASSTAGTVRLNPNGNRSRTAGATFISSSPGTVSAAQFTVSGQPNCTYSITLPANNAVLLTRPGGVNMQVRPFRHSLGSATPKLDASGQQIFTVGSTLRVNANQAPGLYTGEFQVTVAYN